MPLASGGPAPEQMPSVPRPQDQNLNVDIAPETHVEQQVESDGGDARNIAPVEDVPVVIQTAAPVVAPKVVVAPVSPKSEELVAIEKILSDGLEDLYSRLPDNRKAEFRQKGEETATKIEKLMQAAKVHMKKVVGLIRDWLLMIPGVNKFFLEQETKIKADKILEYKAEREGRL